jgi:tetratricopeptide (TPR) repeat protein
MSDDIRLSRVSILIQQGRFAEADQVLREMLAQDANNIALLSMLAEVNLRQDKFDVAKQIVNNAIGLAPDAPHLFYIRSRIAVMQDDYDEAERNISQSIALDPYDADYFALHANIKLNRKQYQEALDLANEALEIDPENLLGLNTRSTALLKLGRKEESFNTIEGALREDPDNALTHANYGWGLLEKGDHKKALEHFKMALKSDPNMQYAQAGMMEALKASNLVYRMFLRYAFWMGNLTAKYQWGVIIGFYLAIRVLRGIANSNPNLQPFLTPVIVILGLFAFSTWIITPVSNLFLRFSRYGQFLLSRKEKTSSNFVAGSFAVFVAGLLGYFILSDDRMLAVAGVGFAMMVPFGMMFAASKHKHVFLIYAALMAVVGIGAIGFTFSTGELFNMFSVVFVIGFILFQWVANFFMIREDNR